MPEGDTLARVAAVLGPALVGQILVEVVFAHAEGAQRLHGGRVSRVWTHGKHLFIEVLAAEAWCLHVHLGMTGSWHLYPRGARWRADGLAFTGLLVTEHHEAVCFGAPTFVLVAAQAAPAAIAHLGPDLLDPSIDLDAIVAAAQDLPERPICDVLLDQRIAAGIGNIYKNELLYYFRCDPTEPVGALRPDELRAFYEKAAAWLATNVGPAGRRTTDDPRPGHALWAYGRAGRPCARCNTPLEQAPVGSPPRVTTGCPRCQRRRRR